MAYGHLINTRYKCDIIHANYWKSFVAVKHFKIISRFLVALNRDESLWLHVFRIILWHSIYYKCSRFARNGQTKTETRRKQRKHEEWQFRWGTQAALPNYQQVKAKNLRQKHSWNWYVVLTVRESPRKKANSQSTEEALNCICIKMLC